MLLVDKSTAMIAVSFLWHDMLAFPVLLEVHVGDRPELGPTQTFWAFGDHGALPRRT